MAQLVVINAVSVKAVNEVGDIVVIMEDSHVFSPAEIGGFDIKRVPGVVADYRTIKTASDALFSKDARNEIIYPRKYILSVKDDAGLTPDDVVQTKLVAVGG